MGYVADFVTGRSIAAGEPAVGVVIVPATKGWPDPVKCAAVDPVYAHERFSPLSLPLNGFVNDRGYFEPNPHQLGLRLLLGVTGSGSWQEFFETAYGSKHEDEPGLEIDGAKVVAGVAAMRPETFRSLVETGKRGQPKADSPLAAARILIDAQKRWLENKESASFLVAIMASPPREEVWTTLEGAEIEVPHCSFGLADGYPWELNASAKRHIGGAYEAAHLMTAGEVAPLFALLSDFQNFSQGLSDVGKYFAPGGFVRHDNLDAVVDLQLSSIGAALENAALRETTGVETREMRFLERMEGIAHRLALLQAAVQDQVAYANRYLDFETSGSTDTLAP